MKKIIGPIIGLLLVLLAAGIAYVNQGTSTLSLWFTEVTLPMWAWIAGLFLLGLIAGLLFLLPTLQSRGDRIHELEEDLDRTKRDKEVIAEETRKESAADLAQKNSEINGLYARIESLEKDIRERIRNSPTEDFSRVTNLEEDPAANLEGSGESSENEPLPSRSERNGHRRTETTRDQEVIEVTTASDRSDLDVSNAETDRIEPDLQADDYVTQDADTIESIDHQSYEGQKDPADATLVVKEYDEDGNKK